MHWNKRNGRFGKSAENENETAARGRAAIRVSVLAGADPWGRRWLI